MSLSIKTALLSTLVATASAQRWNQRRAEAEPAVFTATNTAGGGGSVSSSSAHFQIFGGGANDPILKDLEAAYTCFVTENGWTSSGLSVNGRGGGQYTKFNVYSVTSAGAGAAGVFSGDAKTGSGYVRVGRSYLNQAKITVHEYGHALTYFQKGWTDQGNTGAWWEPTANWFADTYQTSPLCAAARKANGRPEYDTIAEPETVVAKSHLVLVDGTSGSGNYYQSWPFLAYITYNPDAIPGLGKNAVRDAISKYKKGSGETPLHSIQRVANGAAVEDIVGQYWARMAFFDIGHAKLKSKFTAQLRSRQRGRLTGSGGSYTVSANYRPQRHGSNAIPLTVSGGNVSATVSAQGAFTAYIVTSSAAGTKLTKLANGSGSVAVPSGSQVALVVVNTAPLVNYDPFKLTSTIRAPLDYSVKLTGATPA